MGDLLAYELWFSDERPDYRDTDGQPLVEGWYYQFPCASEPVGPFTTSGAAESAIEAEIGEFESTTAGDVF